MSKDQNFIFHLKTASCCKTKIVYRSLTLKGSALSQGIDFPHDTGLNLSGSDSGTHTKINKISNNAIAVAKATTTESLYTVPK